MMLTEKKKPTNKQEKKPVAGFPVHNWLNSLQRQQSAASHSSPAVFVRWELLTHAASTSRTALINQ